MKILANFPGQFTCTNQNYMHEMIQTYANGNFLRMYIIDKSQPIAHGVFAFDPMQWTRAELVVSGISVRARVNAHTLVYLRLQSLRIPESGAQTKASPQEHIHRGGRTALRGPRGAYGVHGAYGARDVVIGEQGFLAIGTNTYGYAFFDNIYVENLDAHAGTPVSPLRLPLAPNLHLNRNL